MDYVVRRARDKDLNSLVSFTVAEAREAEGAESDTADLLLYVHAENTRAIKAYRRCGFGDAPYVIITKDLKSSE